ncbi:hypothetical protein CPB85DRAFT_1257239 [Mucidula mucida]|nr:hypothetical protein CPB85DRAFT_1258889 [Mucidula mucida]KAF8896717.1 hypothetical protein CPB85DRAFT_1257239 [Mucidula mucida]
MSANTGATLHSTSCLWTFVRIHLSASSFDASTAALVRLFIARSNEHPLHVSIVDESVLVEDRYQSSLTSPSPPTGQNLVALMTMMVSMQDDCVEGLLEMLRTTPVLATLRLSLLKGCGTIDKRLTLAAVSGPVFFRVSDLMNVVTQSRRVQSTTVAGLEEVDIYQFLDLDATLEERFQEFLDAGMKGCIR